MSLTILLITYNSSDEIRPCLNSIINQEGGAGQIIVIDNASQDNTTSIINQEYPQVVLIANETNVGFAAAVNQGAKIANREILLLLNPDTVVQNGSLQALREFHQQHPNASIVGGYHEDTNGKKLPSVWSIPSLVTLIAEMTLPYGIYLPLISGKPKRVIEVDSVSGACMSIRRNVFEKLGGFDTRFFMYYEDIDFCLRAKQAVLKIFYTPQVKIIHEQSKSSWKDKQSFFLRFFESKLLFYKKHYSESDYFLVRLILKAGIILRIGAYKVMGAVLFNEGLKKLSLYYITVLKTLF